METDGFAIVTNGLPEVECARVLAALDLIPRGRGRGGIRHLLDVPEVASLAALPSIRGPIVEVLGSSAFAFKATLFEKTAAANWYVGWHQDLTIPIAQKIDVPGFTRWTEKDGVVHAQPPVGVLENVLTVRVNLDAATEVNGSLVVLPGSHRLGFLSDDKIDCFQKTSASVRCLTPAGGLVFMRPLLLHSSAKTNGEQIRRVLHFEFTSVELPGDLAWHRRV